MHVAMMFRSIRHTLDAALEVLMLFMNYQKKRAVAGVLLTRLCIHVVEVTPTPITSKATEAHAVEAGLIKKAMTPTTKVVAKTFLVLAI